MLPLLLSTSFIRGRGEVALLLGSSRYKPTFEGRPRQKPLICGGGHPLSAVLWALKFPPPLCVRPELTPVEEPSFSLFRVPGSLSLLADDVVVREVELTWPGPFESSAGGTICFASILLDMGGTGTMPSLLLNLLLLCDCCCGGCG